MTRMFSCRTARASQMAGELSVEPSSTKMISSLGYVCAVMDVTESEMYFCAL
jgi:hypothetical protein